MGDDLIGDGVGAENAGGEAGGAGGADAGGANSDIFVPPSLGADPLQQALKKNPQNVGIHVAAGEFTKALELLKK